VAPRLFRTRSILICLLLLAVLYFARALWLPLAGYALIHSEPPVKAEIAVVLAGDYHGLRVLKAAELVKAGYVPQALVSGPPAFYGHHESDFAVPFGVASGYPAGYFVALPHEGLSTRTEGEAVLQELKRRNIHHFLLVTSDYHTARARRVYLALEKKAGGGPTFTTVGCPDRYFRADSWWRDREAQKTVFFEWTKTVASVFGM
jgi:uncharacterized SAM-binding protein YcdF (DUF218 family)